VAAHAQAAQGEAEAAMKGSRVLFTLYIVIPVAVLLVILYIGMKEVG
jgi:hypothetical protein